MLSGCETKQILFFVGSSGEVVDCPDTYHCGNTGNVYVVYENTSVSGVDNIYREVLF